MDEEPLPPPAEAESDELQAVSRLLAPGQVLTPADPAAPSGTGHEAPRAAAGAHLVAHRFEVLGPLGQGPNGRVFRARDHREEGRDTALKILRAERTGGREPAELTRALQALLETRRRMAGRAVDRLRDVGRTDLGLFYLASDALQGESVRAWLDRRGPLHPAHALEVARQVAAGLEAGHAVGLAHGAVHARNVFLADGATSSEANPFGVDVRLTDFGLAPALSSAAEGARLGADEDLRALARLLVELLTGEAAPALSPGWERRAVVPLTSRTVDLVQGTLGAEPSVTTVAAFRAGAERALAGRTEPRLRPSGERLAPVADPDATGRRARKGRAQPASSGVWPAVALVLGAVAAALGANAVRPFLKPPREVAASAPADADQVGELRSQLERLADSLTESERGRLDAERRASAAAAAPIAAVQPGVDPAALEQVRTERAQLQAQLDESATRAQAAAEEAVRTREELERSRAELLEARGRIARLEAASVARDRAGDPAWRAAQGVDGVLAALATRTAAGAGEARARLETLRTDALVARDGLVGAALLGACVDAAVARAELQGARDVADALALLARVEAGLATAQAERPALTAQAARWLALDTDAAGGGTAADAADASSARLARIDALLATLAAELEGERGALRPRVDAAWQAVAEPSLARGPDVILPLVAWFEDERLGPWLEGYARELVDAHAAAPRLDVRGLAAVASLEPWADAIQADADLAASLAGREITLVRWARRFWDPAFAEEPAPPWPVVHQGPGGGRPVSGWRAELELAAALTGGRVPYPGVIGGRSVHAVRTPEGTQSFVVSTVLADDAPPGDATRSWIVEQRFLDAAGAERGDHRLRIVQRAKRFYEEDVRQTLVLDLARQGTYEVRFWTPRPKPAPPAALPVDAEALASFGAELMTRGWRCLVRVQGDRTTWYAERWGLVRYDDPERIERELVFLEQP